MTSEKLSKYVFEGTIRNFPSPDVEKDNVNYLAGVREIGVRSEYTDGRDMPRLLIRSVEFEGPLLRHVAAALAQEHLRRFRPQERPAGLCAQDHARFRHARVPPSCHGRGRGGADGCVPEVVGVRPQLSRRA